MSEDHSKYMPHHPKPKFIDGGKAPTKDPMLRARAEATSHMGSGSTPFNADNYGSYHEGMGGGMPMMPTPTPQGIQ